MDQLDPVRFPVKPRGQQCHLVRMLARQGLVGFCAGHLAAHHHPPVLGHDGTTLPPHFQAGDGAQCVTAMLPGNGSAEDATTIAHRGRLLKPVFAGQAVHATMQRRQQHIGPVDDVSIEDGGGR